MRNFVKIVLISFSLTLFLNSCSDLDYGDQLNYEDRIFENYLVTHNITEEPTESGLYYVEEVEGTGATPGPDDWVIINYTVLTLEDEQLVMTTDSVFASNYDLFDSRILYGANKVGIGYNIGGLDEGLSLMKEGGKATLLFKSDLGYGDNTAGTIVSYSSLIIHVELVEVFADPVVNEYEKTINFLQEHEYSTDTTELGIYYVPIIEGKGDAIEDADNVKVNIKVSLLDGRLIYSANAISFEIGSAEYNSTFGLSEGIKLMLEGGKSRIIVPYNYGFGIGFTSYDGNYKVPIPPYSTIVYDVELISSY